MPELESSILPPLDEVETDDAGPFATGAAPYGYLADGVTPRKKPGRKPGSGGGSTSTGVRAASDERLGKRISDELVELSAPMALVSPMAMVHVERRADRTGVALVSISKKYPRVRLAIDSYFNSVAYKDLVIFVTGIPIAFMFDYGILQPESKVGIPWNMNEIWHECYDEGGTEGKPNYAPKRGLAADLEAA